MTGRIKAEYSRLIANGYDDLCALSCAKTNIAFADTESAGLVRLRWIPDEDWDIEDLEGDTYKTELHPEISPKRIEREQKEFREKINQDGVWGLQGEFRILPLHHGTGNIVPTYGGEENEPGWESADGVWGCVGQDGCGYETDIKEQTLEALRKSLRSRCPCCRRPLSA